LTYDRNVVGAMCIVLLLLYSTLVGQKTVVNVV